MSLLDEIVATARDHLQHIVLAEGDDERVVSGGLQAAADGLARVTLVGDDRNVAKLIKGRAGQEFVEIVNPATSPHLDPFVEAYVDLRRHKGMTADKARQAMLHPIRFAAMMVRQGLGDGTVGGAAHTTSETVRAALQIVGKHSSAEVVSSFFLMLLGEPFRRPVVFADCGLIMQPNSFELANIAIASAQSLRALTQQEPRVAMLSFSTMGSASPDAHESINRIRDAIKMTKDREPDLIVDGEIQFDAAIMPDIANMKAPDSVLAGQANVFVFPSLSAGNIGYKIAERLGGAVALGPILQGLAHPANDLSRGCSAEDVYQMIAVTAVQALQARGIAEQEGNAQCAANR